MNPSFTRQAQGEFEAAQKREISIQNKK
jgi:hypothetical protein